MLLLFLFIILSVSMVTNGEPIVNGQDVTKKSPSSYRFVVFLRIEVIEVELDGSIRKRVKQGGGSLIHQDPDIILTAAHNVVFISPPKISVFGGQWKKSKFGMNDKFSKEAVRWEMTDYIVHHTYDASKRPYFNADIALLYVKKQPGYTLNVPVLTGQLNLDLPPDNGTSVTLVGWGRLKKDREAKTLQEGTLFIKRFGFGSNTKYFMWIDDFPNGVQKKGRTAGCAGDSGGPVIHNNAIIAVMVLTHKYDSGQKNPDPIMYCTPGGPTMTVYLHAIRNWLDLNIPTKNEQASKLILN